MRRAGPDSHRRPARPGYTTSLGGFEGAPRVGRRCRAPRGLLLGDAGILHALVTSRLRQMSTCMDEQGCALRVAPSSGPVSSSSAARAGALPWSHRASACSCAREGLRSQGGEERVTAPPLKATSKALDTLRPRGTAPSAVADPQARLLGCSGFNAQGRPVPDLTVGTRPWAGVLGAGHLWKYTAVTHRGGPDWSTFVYRGGR